MSAQRHRIRRQVFEVTVEDASAAWRVQTELARVQSRRLGGIIESCLSELSAPDRLLRIDSLEVDLGTLNPDNLEQELVEKLGPALRAALLQRIEQDRHDDALVGEDPAVRSQLELVAFFARTGSLPWWADTSRPRPVDDAVALLLLRAPAPLTALVRALLRERGLLRLVLHLADARVAELAGLLLPRAHAEQKSVLFAQAALLRELLPAVAVPASGAAAWRGALALALVQAASSPTAGSEGPEALVQDVLARAAGAASLPLRTVVAGLLARLQTLSAEPRSAPRELLAAIVQRLAAPPAPLLARAQERARTQPHGAAEEASDREANETQPEAEARREPAAPPESSESAERAEGAEAAADPAALNVPGAPAVLPADRGSAAARSARRGVPQDGARGAPSREPSDAARTARSDAAPNPTSDAAGDARAAAASHAADAEILGAAAEALGGAAREPRRHVQSGALPEPGPGAAAAAQNRALGDAPAAARDDASGDAVSDARDRAGASARAAATASGAGGAAARPSAGSEQQSERSAEQGAAAQDARAAAAGRADGAAASGAPAPVPAPARRSPPEPSEAEVDALLARLTPLAGPLQPLLVELQAAGARAPEIKAALLQPLQLLEAYLKRGDGPGPAPELVLQRLLGPLRRRGLVSPQAPGPESTALPGGPPRPQSPEPAAPPLHAPSFSLPPAAGPVAPPSEAQHASATRHSEQVTPPLPAARSPRAAAPEQALVPSPAAPASLRPVPDRAVAAETPPWAARSPRRHSPGPLAFSESDALYVDNAGLVLLWPFLGRFFARLGLQEEGMWRDRAALHRAIGLLQHIATGELEPQEHQLALAKVLCGLPTDEVFVFGDPVTAAEAEEAADLIGAAIVNAPPLSELSVAELRGAFLNRPGALAVRSGSWLLRVERAEQDAVLEQLPWGLGWVALPWLEQALCIEW